MSETAGPRMADRTARLVVGIDGSSRSLRALHWAVAYAEHTAGHVHAVMVYSPPAVVGTSATGAITASEALVEDETLRDAAQRRLDAAIAELPEGAARIIEPSVVYGEAAAALLKLAEDAQLLVLGNPSRGAFTAAVVGSIALRCVHHAHCPVVLVPD